MATKFRENTSVIMITDNPTIKNHYECTKEVLVVYHQKEDSVGEVVKNLNEAIVKTLVNKGDSCLSGERLSNEFLTNFSLKKSFLDNIQVSNNLLCSANEIIWSQTRGKVPDILGLPMPIEDIYAYDFNVKASKEILSERLVDILLGAENNEGHSIPLRKVSLVFKQKIHEFSGNFTQLSNEEKKKKYAELTNIAFSELNQIFSRHEITLLLPTVNLASRKNLIEMYQSRLPSNLKSRLPDIIDTVLQGGRGFYLSEDVKGTELEKIIKEIYNTRLSENVFLTYMTALFSARKLSPILKVTTSPSMLFNDILKLRAYIESGYLSQKTTSSWCMTTGERFKVLQERLASYIPETYLQFIDSIQPSNLTIISDLPFELATCKDGIALCQMFPTTRIPITPLGSTFRHLNVASQKGAVFEDNFLESILVVTSLNESDPVYFEYELFIRVCKKLGLHFNAVKAESSDDFIASINNSTPGILIYFGHGSYDDERDVGTLIFKNDVLSFDKLENIRAIPNIVFLFGCETAACNAFFGGLPAHLLERGVFSIVATVFPIPGEVCGSFLGRVIAFIEDGIRKKAFITLSKIVFEARKLGWIMDNLNHLVNVGAISYSEMGSILAETGNEATRLSKEKGFTIPLIDGINVFKDVLSKHQVLDSWQFYQKNIVTYSLFFTLLGDSSNVLFGSSDK